MPVSRLTWDLYPYSVPNGEGNPLLCAAHPFALFWDVCVDLEEWTQHAVAGNGSIQKAPPQLCWLGGEGQRMKKCLFFF